MTIDAWYKLETVFKSKTEACSYLWKENFERNEHVPNNWNNELTGVDAHMSQVTEKNGDKTILITYHAPHIERRRKLLKIKEKYPDVIVIPRFGGKFGGVTV